MSKSEQCEWCSNYGASNFGYKQNDKEYISTKKFCSKKCEAEYDDRYGVKYELKSGCFVATAVYGNYDHPVVLDLRYFRDSFLTHKNWGRSFISLYYTHSPNWANIIRRNRVFRALTLLLVIKPLHIFVKLILKNK